MYTEANTFSKSNVHFNTCTNNKNINSRGFFTVFLTTTQQIPNTVRLELDKMIVHSKHYLRSCHHSYHHTVQDRFQLWKLLPHSFHLQSSTQMNRRAVLQRVNCLSLRLTVFRLCSSHVERFQWHFSCDQNITSTTCFEKKKKKKFKKTSARTFHSFNTRRPKINYCLPKVAKNDNKTVMVKQLSFHAQSTEGIRKRE